MSIWYNLLGRDALVERIQGLCNELITLTEIIKELQAAQRWIPVGERLPDEIGWYPVWLNTPRGKLTLQEDVYWAPGWPFIDDGETVVYWHHPLPDPPAEDGTE
jgi:hypothetical protein